ncbi:zinc-binding dehydrogenase [Alcanivorax quisquiliarum]|uniref:Alcohol dehydrogenase catalytic domain-containing protein n=1 Tax=Alcanivorax quisquiliarum TaxID=2933565 RepID=A0ABT0E987_9GAMM|nr:alcohol dehydrogenase catalytic domain-containing protein [Alcanivorax quisquiliarum]MCK0538403.1 alcohol dehydrogenase catalytic domain-containing protein [Alcanivorax quisquiliarum]
MQAIVFDSPGRLATREMPEPSLLHASDAIVDIQLAAIGGTDRHFIDDPHAGLTPGTIVGREAVGLVRETGRDVRNLSGGDRVVICPAIACGNCVYCRAGYHAQCNATDAGRQASGPALFGAPETLGGLPGLCAERARVPYAHTTLVRLPDEISNAEAVMLADIWSSAWFTAHLAEIRQGDTVAVFGCGPLGQATVACALLRGASRVFAVDRHEDRLARARALGAEVIHSGEESPVAVLRDLTDGIGVDRAIDAAGSDLSATAGSDTQQTACPDGSAEQPRQSVQLWAMDALAKAGTLALTGLWSGPGASVPIALAVARNLTIRAGFCHYRIYLPKVIELCLAGRIDVSAIPLHTEPMANAAEAYQQLDQHQRPWSKLAFQPAPTEQPAARTDTTSNTNTKADADAAAESAQLDDALEDSFPASDPPSIARPGDH